MYIYIYIYIYLYYYHYFILIIYIFFSFSFFYSFFLYQCLLVLISFLSIFHLVDIFFFLGRNAIVYIPT